jgi:hypothetical protein
MNHLQRADSNTTNLLVIPTSTEKLIISSAYTMQAKVFHEYVISIYNNILIDSFGFIMQNYLCRQQQHLFC